jgi:hypothetical protein
LNTKRTIDVTFKPTEGYALDANSILDDAPEFSLERPAAAGVQPVSGAPTLGWVPNHPVHLIGTLDRRLRTGDVEVLFIEKARRWTPPERRSRPPPRSSKWSKSPAS